MTGWLPQCNWNEFVDRSQYTRDDSKEKVKMGDGWRFLALKAFSF